MLDVIVLGAAVVIPSGAALTVFLMRETKRLYAFDKRLAISRAEALKLKPLEGSDEPDRRAAGTLFRDFSLAAMRGFSLLAPFGAKERDKLARMLRTAGVRHPDAVAIYLCIKLVLAVAAGSAVSFAAAGIEPFSRYPATVGFVFVAGALVGGLLPETVIRARSSSRNRQMAEALPSALDLLVMCLGAGLTFERSLLTTAEELEAIEASLARELRALEAELRVGSDHRTVLRTSNSEQTCPGCGTSQPRCCRANTTAHP